MKLSKITQVQSRHVIVVLLALSLTACGYYPEANPVPTPSPVEVGRGSGATLGDGLRGTENVLTENDWVWLRTEMNDGSVTQAKEGLFVLSFDQEMFFSTTDCNTLRGEYTFDPDTGALSFGQAASTMMFCEGSIESEYARQLTNVQSVMFEGDLAYFQIMFDSGSMVFQGRPRTAQ